MTSPEKFSVLLRAPIRPTKRSTGNVEISIFSAFTPEIG
jgi:hypothetical protein